MTSNNSKTQIGVQVDSNTMANLTKLRASLEPGNILSISETIRRLINGQSTPNKATKSKAKRSVKKSV